MIDKSARRCNDNIRIFAEHRFLHLQIQTSDRERNLNGCELGQLLSYLIDLKSVVSVLVSV